MSDGPYTRVELVGRVVASGLSFYLYNEVAVQQQQQQQQQQQ